MRSVADDLREELRERVRRLPVRERMALAFRLGDEDLARLMRAQGLTRDAALAVLTRARSAGRRASKVNDR